MHKFGFSSIYYCSLTTQDRVMMVSLLLFSNHLISDHDFADVGFDNDKKKLFGNLPDYDAFDRR